MSECCASDILTGYTPKTAQNFQLDSGVWFKDYIVGTDTPATAQAKIIGATQGGSSIAVTPTMRQALVDGLQGEWAGGKRILFWDAVGSPNFVEVSKGVADVALAAVNTVTSAFYEEITSRHHICDEDFIENVTFIGTISGSDDPIIIQLFKVLNMNGFNFTSADATEAVVATELKAHYDPLDPGVPPFKIYMPKSQGTVTGIVSNAGGAVADATVTVTISGKDYVTTTNELGAYILCLPYGTGYTAGAAKAAEVGTSALFDVVGGQETSAVDITIS